MKHTASLFFPASPDAARAIATALAPEATQSEVPKTRGEAHASHDGVRVVVHAEDLASLRAAVNSYCRWVDAAAKAAALGTR
jgi:tRNA threonylcarbamoyladenosine modification (KEOPS) complex  Pcc1 subunit